MCRAATVADGQKSPSSAQASSELRAPPLNNGYLRLEGVDGGSQVIQMGDGRPPGRGAGHCRIPASSGWRAGRSGRGPHSAGGTGPKRTTEGVRSARATWALRVSPHTTQPVPGRSSGEYSSLTPTHANPELVALPQPR